ncbi:MAG: OsmC family protein [Dissulfurispiraceae bacterium]|nr:OsmC family protein [Dissulfurispiraceae bacterium]
MEIKITFPGNKKVFADTGEFIIQTDQSIDNGGDATAPSPYTYFLSSIGTCAGIYVLSFCRKRDIPTDGISIVQKMEYKKNEKGKEELHKIVLELILPADFPEKYIDAVKKSAGLCSVKETIMNPPQLDIVARISE